VSSDIKSTKHDEADMVLLVAKEVMQFLLEARAVEFISIPSFSLTNSNDLKGYKISRFGRATMQSGISPDEAIVLYEDLIRALSGINLESDLHLLYLITPQDRGLYPDFQKLFKWYTNSQYQPLDKDHSLSFVCDSTGITEGLLSKWSFQPPGKNTVSQSGATVRGLSLSRWTDSNNTNGKAFLSESEWKALSRCRRLWAAMALDTLLKGVT
jgi:hypothetical protein